MPAGASWGRYLSFQASGLLAAVLGAQFVHLIYRPLDDLPEMIERAKQEEKEGKKLEEVEGDKAGAKVERRPEEKTERT